ncbi:MAG: alanine racemase [Leptospirales bacterium]|nr:alanine racemase [Leptospirales bacterium]
MALVPGMQASRIEISRSAMLANVDALQSLAPESIFLAVIKSNAYGHGLEEAAGILRGRVRAFGVNSFGEFLRLRQVDAHTPCLIMGLAGLEFEELAAWLSQNSALTLPEIVVSSPEALQQALVWPITPPLHLKLDTGLSRLGADRSGWQACLQMLAAQPAAPWVGVMTHFADVEDVSDQRTARRQLQRFEEERAAVAEAAGQRRLLWHAAASAALVILPESRLDLVRAGISLYGLWASPQTRLSALSIYGRLPELRPALRWLARIAMIKTVAAGESVGYGCTVQLESETRLAVIPVGYYEGYERALSNRGAYVLIRGRRARLVGRVMMNMLIVDIQHIPEARPGDEAVLIGRQGEEELSADHLAALTGTINYEVTTRLNATLPRIVTE